MQDHCTCAGEPRIYSATHTRGGGRADGDSLAIGAGLNVYKPLSATTSATPSDRVCIQVVTPPIQVGGRRQASTGIPSNWTAPSVSLVPLGALRVRPVMAGYGYVYRMRRMTWFATGFAGVSFHSFEPGNAARLAFIDQLARVLLDADAAFGPAAKAELSGAYDLNDRVGVMASVASLWRQAFGNSRPMCCCSANRGGVAVEP